MPMSNTGQVPMATESGSGFHSNPELEHSPTQTLEPHLPGSPSLASRRTFSSDLQVCPPFSCVPALPVMRVTAENGLPICL